MPLTKYELRDRFVEDILGIYNLYNSLSRHATNPEKLVLAEQTCVSITVALESFISELLVSLISDNSNLYLTNQCEEMKNLLLKSGYSHPRVKFLAHEGLKKLNGDELREFIINDGDNLSFSETQKLSEFMLKNLPKALVLDVTTEDEAFIDLLKSTRNLCAHHSQKAARTLSGMHKKFSHDMKIKDGEVCRILVQENEITARNVGEYLKAELVGLLCRNRVEYIYSYLREMVFRWVR